MKTNEEMFAELDAFIDSVGSKPSEMIAILHTAQGIFGYLPMKVQKHIADRLHVNVSQVYGVVTFYSFFTMKPKGENVISICLGTACFVKGSGKLLEACENHLGIKNGETTFINTELNKSSDKLIEMANRTLKILLSNLKDKQWWLIIFMIFKVKG